MTQAARTIERVRDKQQASKSNTKKPVSRDAHFRLAYDSRHRLNTVCPYYTMFPLEFPINLLRNKPKSLVILDPFCGRGTTNYAARHLGFHSYGFDTSPVAVAIAKAKLVTTTAENVIALAERYLAEPVDYNVPTDEFWQYAYHPETLDEICRIRSRLLRANSSNSVHMLRAVMIGALHGPLPRKLNNAGYFSNQMPRTFAAKPRYALKYWKNLEMLPPKISAIDVIKKRSEAALRSARPTMFSPAAIRLGDAADWKIYKGVNNRVDLVITSPPYYGLRTYIEDQWLRHWFLGGKDSVVYGGHSQLNHSSPEKFAANLGYVWDNIAEIGSQKLRMVIRFGGIASRYVAPDEVLRQSLKLSDRDWEIKRSRGCGTASDGKRQANHMVRYSSPIQERDYSISLLT